MSKISNLSIFTWFAETNGVEYPLQVECLCSVLEGDERTDSSLWAGVTWGRWKLFASTDPHLTGASHPGRGCCSSRFLVLISLCWCRLCSAWLGLGDCLTGTGWLVQGWLGQACDAVTDTTGYLVTGTLLGPCFVSTVSRVSGGSEGENTAVVVGCVDCEECCYCCYQHSTLTLADGKPSHSQLGQHSTQHSTQHCTATDGCWLSLILSYY